MRILILLAIFLTGTFVRPCAGWGKEDRIIHRLARQQARTDRKDFAFMYFRSLLREHPDSRYADFALFGQGEYFFELPNYKLATESFESYVDQYPDAKGKLFALAYLLKMARTQGQIQRVKDLEKEIISVKQLGLVFSDYKEYTYRTPLNREFKTVFHIDRIEFYVGGKLFEKITY